MTIEYTAERRHRPDSPGIDVNTTTFLQLLEAMANGIRAALTAGQAPETMAELHMIDDQASLRIHAIVYDSQKDPV